LLSLVKIYHGNGEANGLCFSVNGIRIPRLLRNIFREMSDDLGTVLFPTSGNLDSWATQGVLLLNNTLTVRKDTIAMQTLKMECFTDAVIQKISEEKGMLCFLLGGRFAHKKGT
jgi:uracil-DNA glycosylase